MNAVHVFDPIAASPSTLPQPRNPALDACFRYRGLATTLCVAEPTGGGFACGWRTRDPGAVASRTTLIEGIGRPRAEPGFVFDVVDAVIEVDDVQSIAAMHQLEGLLGRRYGGSSGTNFVACLRLACAMRARGERGSIVSLLGDRGERYEQTLFSSDWLRARGIDIAPTTRALEHRIATGRGRSSSVSPS